jgi:hypothetical protein
MEIRGASLPYAGLWSSFRIADNPLGTRTNASSMSECRPYREVSSRRYRSLSFMILVESVTVVSHGIFVGRATMLVTPARSKA